MGSPTRAARVGLKRPCMYATLAGLCLVFTGMLLADDADTRSRAKSASDAPNADVTFSFPTNEQTASFIVESDEAKAQTVRIDRVAWAGGLRIRVNGKNVPVDIVSDDP